MTHRPVPKVTSETARFWHALRERRIELQRCSQCGYLRYPPRWLCPECLAEAHQWEVLSGMGEIHSFLWYYRSLDPRFPHVPYNVAIVQLDEGPQLYTNIVGVGPEDLRVQQRVMAEFETVDEGHSVLLFRLQNI
jgi:uncharacterized OB-fold protein